MLADLVLILAAILVVGLVAAWEVFCLTDLTRAEKMRLLPRWAWAVGWLIQIPLGGVLYLLIGRAWQRQSRTAASS
jgi:hypothetical protein